MRVLLLLLIIIIIILLIRCHENKETFVEFEDKKIKGMAIIVCDIYAYYFIILDDDQFIEIDDSYSSKLDKYLYSKYPSIRTFKLNIEKYLNCPDGYENGSRTKLEIEKDQLFKQLGGLDYFKPLILKSAKRIKNEEFKRIFIKINIKCE